MSEQELRLKVLHHNTLIAELMRQLDNCGPIGEGKTCALFSKLRLAEERQRELQQLYFNLYQRQPSLLDIDW